MAKPFTDSDAAYVKFFTVGSSDPNTPPTPAMLEKQNAELNELLGGRPRGHVISKIYGITIYQLGDTQVPVSWVTYQIGYRRKPTWATK